MAALCHIDLAFSSASRDGRRMALPRTVVFDLDGTLVDTGPDLTASLNHALADLGRAPVDPTTVRHLVSHGALAMIERGLALSGGGSEAETQRALTAFLQYYAANIATHSRPFDGVEAALDGLAAAGVQLAVCTNKRVALSRALIEALGWTGRFAANLGGDSLSVRKPDPAHVLATIAAAGGDPATSAFVGDSIVDVTAARAANIPVVAVSFGFADRPVAELGATAVIDHYDELLAALDGLYV